MQQFAFVPFEIRNLYGENSRTAAEAKILQVPIYSQWPQEPLLPQVHVNNIQVVVPCIPFVYLSDISLVSGIDKRKLPKLFQMPEAYRELFNIMEA